MKSMLGFLGCFIATIIVVAQDNAVAAALFGACAALWGEMCLSDLQRRPDGHE